MDLDHAEVARQQGDQEEEEDNNDSLVHHVLVQKKTISQDHQVLPCTAALPLASIDDTLRRENR